MTIKALNCFLVQQVIPPMFFCYELSLLNELPDPDRRYSENFCRTFGRNEIHQAISSRSESGQKSSWSFQTNSPKSPMRALRKFS